MPLLIPVYIIMHLNRSLSAPLLPSHIWTFLRVFFPISSSCLAFGALALLFLHLGRLVWEGVWTLSSRPVDLLLRLTKGHEPPLCWSDDVRNLPFYVPTWHKNNYQRRISPYRLLSYGTRLRLRLGIEPPTAP